MVIFQSYVSLPEGTGWPVLLEVGQKNGLTLTINHLQASSWSVLRPEGPNSSNFADAKPRAVSSVAGNQRFFWSLRSLTSLSSQESNREVPAGAGGHHQSPISMVNSSRLFWAKAETLIFMGKKNTAGFWRSSKKQIEYIQKNKMTSSKPTFFLRARCPIGLGSLTSNLCSVLCKLNLRR